MTRSERAMQVWQILIGAAHNRQTLTYGQVVKTISALKVLVCWLKFLAASWAIATQNSSPSYLFSRKSKCTGPPGAGIVSHSVV